MDLVLENMTLADSEERAFGSSCQDEAIISIEIGSSQPPVLGQFEL